jgi:hypothetical protein
LLDQPLVEAMHEFLDDVGKSTRMSPVSKLGSDGAAPEQGSNQSTTSGYRRGVRGRGRRLATANGH